MDKLIKYLNSISRPEQDRFAEACGTSAGYLRKAASAGQLLSAKTCVLIEQESRGEITRKDLHPSDWAAYWPELATPSNTTPASAAVRESNPEKNA